MQVLDEQKRLKILSVAAELFASLPFHKVILSDVAEAAGVGKGTLYTYFKSKEDLFLSVLYAGFTDLLERLRVRINEQPLSPSESLEAVVHEFVTFAFQNPHYFEVMRSVRECRIPDRAKWDQLRRETNGLVESVIRKGIGLGYFQDPHPELTARIIPGCVRSLMLDGKTTMTAPTMSAHILWIIMSAIRTKDTGP